MGHIVPWEGTLMIQVTIRRNGEDISVITVENAESLELDYENSAILVLHEEYDPNSAIVAVFKDWLCAVKPMPRKAQ